MLGERKLGDSLPAQTGEVRTDHQHQHHNQPTPAKRNTGPGKASFIQRIHRILQYYSIDTTPHDSISKYFRELLVTAQSSVDLIFKGS